MSSSLMLISLERSMVVVATYTAANLNVPVLLVNEFDRETVATFSVENVLIIEEEYVSTCAQPTKVYGLPSVFCGRVSSIVTTVPDGI